MHAIIVIHGILKDSNAEYNDLMSVIPKEKEANYIVVIPQYLTQADVKKFGLPAYTLTWNFEKWDEGEKSISKENKSGPSAISSFTVVDNIIQRLSDKHYFPHLNSVVLIGFSAGAQFVQRYAAATKINENLNQMDIKVTYIPISPSSYLYFNTVRPIGSNNEFIDLSLNQKNQCPSYNNYKYGMEGLNSYFSKINYNFIINNYRKQRMIYIVGKKDTKRDIFLDKSCAADLQGKQRLERATDYFQYLHLFYAKKLSPEQRILLIDGATHDFKTIVKSHQLQFYLFG